VGRRLLRPHPGAPAARAQAEVAAGRVDEAPFRDPRRGREEHAGQAVDIALRTPPQAVVARDVGDADRTAPPRLDVVALPGVADDCAGDEVPARRVGAAVLAAGGRTAASDALAGGVDRSEQAPGGEG